jgi:adenosylcobinamide-GDP ribazoletransferase
MPVPAFLRRWIVDLQLAAALLTRVPTGGPSHVEPADLARAVRAYPLVGAAIGAVGGAVILGGLALGLPGMVAACLAIAVLLVVTGGFHEDGLADTADGFGGGRDAAAKLAIMRDHRIGSYGALALGVMLLTKVGALASLQADAFPALIAAHAASRAVLGGLLTALPAARGDGLARLIGRPGQGAATQAGLLGVLVVVLTAASPDGAALVIAVVGITVWLVGWMAWRQIGGVTGDVCGATQQAVETAVLVAWCIR